MRKPVIGIQMYSLRDEAERDFLGTLKKVTDIGYEAAELAGCFNMPAKRLRSEVQALGLIIPSMIVSINFNTISKMASDLARDLEYADELGVKWIVSPWIPVSEVPSMDEVNYLTEVLSRCGEQVRSAGMKYAIHNHESEFKVVDGTTMLDRLLEQVPADLLGLELDIGWAALAGQDAGQYMHRYKERIAGVHMRDFESGRRDVELGKGKLDCDRLVGELCAAGIDNVYAEQEQFAEGSLESAAANFAYLKKMVDHAYVEV
ncbi:sugar phosphate isomerase/epimerase [Paenibacillus sp. J5C_2022]|uniref:sugar phosphate isomerase/epimerase family protein n=1 Tax=Paenibacillus sp. J5C2022 TaxID=2977129 RepID=UPI0021D2E7DA|nr:sugar phosphate isomerase/epimerase [Paenibacillus sp. J5C2022]MCU6712402.1 sugar phosphate isomerase/epimerase [Paenibacillus sp. J5C2022]